MKKPALTEADVCRDLMVQLGRAQGWTEQDIDRILHPAGNDRAVAEVVENGLRAHVRIDPGGFYFEVSRCGREADGPIHVSTVEREFEDALATAKRWCSGPPQLSLFGGA